MFIIWLINTEFGHLPKKKKKKRIWSYLQDINVWSKEHCNKLRVNIDDCHQM